MQTTEPLRAHQAGVFKTITGSVSPVKEGSPPSDVPTNNIRKIETKMIKKNKRKPHPGRASSNISDKRIEGAAVGARMLL
jgi:hypothetical protein